MAETLQRLNSEMHDVVEQTQQALVQVSSGRSGVGSGVIWQSNGLIITNAHVVHRRENHLKVTLVNGDSYPAKVLARDDKHDLAAISIDATDLPAIQLGDSRALQPGAWVMGVGHPWGIKGAVTAGSVIDVGQSLELALPHGDLIQVGLHLRPGHSGGPLVDAQGQLVGISAMINGPDVGLAIPLHVVQEFIAQLDVPTDDGDDYNREMWV
ncbi:MAG: trypsin-like peptidase domain-containing protein [Chloroflexota bacterium]